MAKITKTQEDQIDLLSLIKKPKTDVVSAVNVTPPEKRLNLQGKILTNPTVSAAIDFLSGGRSIKEAEQAKSAELNRISKIPGQAADVGKFFARPFLPKRFGGRDNTFTDFATMAEESLFPIVSAPFIPAAAAITSGINSEDKSIPGIIKSALKGFTAPESAPTLFKGITDQPLSEFERGGSTKIGSVARLIPRATMQAAETVALGFMLGVPRATKKAINRRVADIKKEGALRDIDADFAKIDTAEFMNRLDKQGLFPRQATQAQKMEVSLSALERLRAEVQTNPKLRGVYEARQKVFQDPATKFKSESGQLGFPIEEPVSKAVKSLNNTVSSGFHEKFSKEFNGIEPSWAIVVKGKLSSQVKIAAEKSGLKLNEREVYKGAVEELGDAAKLTDIYLPDVGQKQSKKATSIFNTFADNLLKKESEKVPRAIESILSTGKVKPTINFETGLKKQKTPTSLSEEQLLRRELQQEGKAAREGAIEGRKEVRIQERSRRQGIISNLKDILTRRVATEKHKGELKLLKEDIKARDKFTAALAKEKVKRIEDVKNVKRKSELQRLQDDIKRRDVLRVKNELKNYVKENLPKESQGKFIDAVGRVRTGEQLSREFRRVDREVKNIERKETIEAVKTSVNKIAESRKIDIDSQKKVLEIFNEIDFVKRNPETLDKLRNLKEVFDKKEKLGEDMEIPNRIWRKLEILLRRPASEINTAELRNIKDNIDDIAKVGETKLRVRDSIYKLEKERKTKEITEKTIPLEKHPLIERQPGEKLPLKENIGNVLANLHNEAIRIDIANTPMDSYFDLLDGGTQTFDGPMFRTFKQEVDTNFQTYLRESWKDKQRLTAMAKEIKLTDLENELMGVYAAKIQKGGVQKLLDTDVDQKTIDKADLNPRTEKLYQMWRNISEELRPKIQEVLREEWNLPFEKVENYFPFTTDWEKMSDSEIYNRFGKDFNEKSLIEENEGKRTGKKVKFSFMEKRVGGKQKIQLNFIDVALRHLDNAYYMINMSRTLRMLKEISNNPKVESSIGELGSKWTKEWVDLMVKKGGRLGDKQIAVLDMLRRNFGIARLGGNITTGLIQVTAIQDGAMILGNDAFSGLGEIITSQQARNFVIDNMPEIKLRTGDDPAYRDFSTIPILGKAQEVSYDHIKFFDRLAAMGVGMGAYRQKLKNKGIEFDPEKPNKEALDFAQLVVRRTQASSLFKDTPSSLRGGLTGSRSLDKFINQFQTFMLNRWNNVRSFMFRAKILGGIKKDPNAKDFKAAFNAAFYLILAVLTEVAIRRGEKRLEEKFVEFVTGGFIDKKKRSFSQEYAVNLGQTVPFVSQGISVSYYRGDFAPSLSALRDAVTAGPAILSRKTPVGKNKAVLDLASGVGGIGGIPFTGQIEKTGKLFAEATSKDAVIGMYKQALRTNDPDKKVKWEERADALAIKKGLSIKRMKESAERSIKREESGFVSKLEKKFHDKPEEEFTKGLTKMMKSGELSQKGANRVKSLRNRRLKDEQKLERELEEQLNPTTGITPEILKKLDELAK